MKIEQHIREIQEMLPAVRVGEVHKGDNSRSCQWGCDGLEDVTARLQSRPFSKRWACGALSAVHTSSAVLGQQCLTESSPRTEFFLGFGMGLDFPLEVVHVV